MNLPVRVLRSFIILFLFGVGFSVFFSQRPTVGLPEFERKPSSPATSILSLDDIVDLHQWRGLLLDVSRHFFSIPTLLKVIDVLREARLNVLHLHLSDDQAFRIQIPGLLHLNRSFDSLSYSVTDLMQVVDYANRSGIHVIPELDIPGHTSAILEGDSQLGNFNAQLKRQYGPHHDCIDASKLHTRHVLKKVIETLLSIFPAKYLHLGGDEVSCRERQSHVILRETVHWGLDLLGSLGRKAMFWDEVIHLMPENAPKFLTQAWRELPNTIDIAQKSRGYLVQSHGLYLDHLVSSKELLEVELSTNTLNVVGAEACMWTELVTEENLFYRIWPRVQLLSARLLNESISMTLCDILNDWDQSEALVSWQRVLQVIAGKSFAKSTEHLQLVLGLLEPISGSHIPVSCGHCSTDLTIYDRLVYLLPTESKYTIQFAASIQTHDNPGKCRLPLSDRVELIKFLQDVHHACECILRELNHMHTVVEHLKPFLNPMSMFARTLADLLSGTGNSCVTQLPDSFQVLVDIKHQNIRVSGFLISFIKALTC